MISHKPTLNEQGLPIFTFDPNVIIRHRESTIEGDSVGLNRLLRQLYVSVERRGSRAAMKLRQAVAKFP